MCLPVVGILQVSSYDLDDVPERNTEWGEISPDNAFYVTDDITIDEYHSVVKELDEIDIEYWKIKDSK